MTKNYECLLELHELCLRKENMNVAIVNKVSKKNLSNKSFWFVSLGYYYYYYLAKGH